MTSQSGRIILLVGLALSFVACDSPKAPPPCVNIFEKEWKEAYRDGTGKEVYYKSRQVVFDHVATLSKEQFAVEFACALDTRREDRYHEVLLEAVALRLIRDKDEVRCEQLFEKSFPSTIALGPTEGWMAQEGFADVVDFLIGCYRKSQSQGNKRVIAQAFRRMFWSLPPAEGAEATDEKFIGACEEWWQGNRNRVKFNVEYMSNSNLVPVPLFVSRD